MAKKQETNIAKEQQVDAVQRGQPDPNDRYAGVKPDPNGDIDQRMAALLQDHKKMGSR